MHRWIGSIIRKKQIIRDKADEQAYIFSTPVTTTATTGGGGGNSISKMKGCWSVSFPAIKMIC
jgi:hypothetical protein